jgi:poly-gamma-glutamate synthesis protein (capsule biosynthesis protein)
VVIASIHWGDNWGYEIPERHRHFAHRLIDTAGVDVVHGHSSHHPLPIEVHRGRPILYGCGDFLNDYEGISGHEEYRSELTSMYFVSLDPASRALTALELVPMRIRRLRLERASTEEAGWLAETMTREGASFGTSVVRDGETLRLRWG